MKYAGSDFLLQVLDDIDWLSSLSDRSTSITIANEQVDTTSKGSSQWRELNAFGTRTADLSASGIVSDRPVFRKFMSAYFNRQKVRVRVVSGPDMDVIIEADYSIASIERTGEYNNAEQYSISFASAGPAIDQPDILTTESGLIITTESGRPLAV